MTTRERIARVIHAADSTHCREPWAEVAARYNAMAQAVLDDMVCGTKPEGYQE